jgi:hypothetical protein
LRHTLSLLLLGLGRHETSALLDEYTRAFAPEPFAAIEAEQFCQWLRGLLPRLQGRMPLLAEVLAFEQALVRVYPPRHREYDCSGRSIPLRCWAPWPLVRPRPGWLRQSVTMVVEAS